MNTTLQMRVDGKTKERARRAFEASGLDISSGLRLFLTHVGRTGEVPFELFSYDNAPEALKRKLVKEATHTLVHEKGYASARAMHQDILGKKKS